MEFGTKTADFTTATVPTSAPIIDNTVKTVSDHYYKLVGGSLQRYDPERMRLLRVGNTVYANPTEAQIKAAGYKHLAAPDYPTEVEGYYIATAYDDSGENIVATYSYEKIDITE